MCLTKVNLIYDHCISNTFLFFFKNNDSLLHPYNHFSLVLKSVSFGHFQIVFTTSVYLFPRTLHFFRCLAESELPKDRADERDNFKIPKLDVHNYCHLCFRHEYLNGQKENFLLLTKMLHVVWLSFIIWDIDSIITICNMPIFQDLDPLYIVATYHILSSKK